MTNIEQNVLRYVDENEPVTSTEIEEEFGGVGVSVLLDLRDDGLVEYDRGESKYRVDRDDLPHIRWTGNEADNGGGESRAETQTYEVTFTVEGDVDQPGTVGSFLLDALRGDAEWPFDLPHITELREVDD